MEKFIDWFIRLRFISAILREIYPHSGYCFHCRVPWRWFKNEEFLDKIHSTKIGNGRGTFPFCKYCWGRITIDDIEKTNFVYWDHMDTKDFNHRMNCILADKKGKPLYKDRD